MILRCASRVFEGATGYAAPVFALLSFVGCGTPAPVAVSPRDLPRLVQDYHLHNKSVIRDAEGRLLSVQASTGPVLSTCRKQIDVFDRMAIALSNNCELIRVSLSEVHLVGGSVILGDKSVRVEDLGFSSLEFDGDDPRELAIPAPGEKGNRWGANVTVAGPAGLVGTALDFRAFRWLGLEVGVVPIPGAGGGFAGVRASPWRISRVSPFVGAHASVWIVGEGGDGSEAETVTSYGARAGLGIDLRRDLELRGEFDLAYGWLFGSGWIPCGGAAIASYW